MLWWGFILLLGFFGFSKDIFEIFRVFFIFSSPTTPFLVD